MLLCAMVALASRLWQDCLAGLAAATALGNKLWNSLLRHCAVLGTVALLLLLLLPVLCRGLAAARGIAAGCRHAHLPWLVALARWRPVSSIRLLDNFHHSLLQQLGAARRAGTHKQQLLLSPLQPSQHLHGTM